MINEEALAIVIAELKKKKKQSLAERLYEALGIDFDVDTNISEKELQQALKNIKQYIPVESKTITPSKEAIINLVTDIFITNKKVTSEIIETVATVNSIPKSEIDDIIYDITQAFWARNSSKSQLQSQLQGQLEDERGEIVYSSPFTIECKDEEGNIIGFIIIKNIDEDTINIATSYNRAISYSAKGSDIDLRKKDLPELIKILEKAELLKISEKV